MRWPLVINSSERKTHELATQIIERYQQYLQRTFFTDMAKVGIVKCAPTQKTL